MKTVAVLRSYPKDASLGKVLTFLSRQYQVDCYLWDRQNDYQPLVENENLRYRRCRLRAGYYNLATFLKLFLFELWLFAKLITTKLDAIHAMDLDTGFVGLCVAKLRRKPFVYQCLDPYYMSLPPNWPRVLATLARWLENVVISQADLFIITDRLRLPQHDGATPKRMIELANVPFLDLAQFKVAAHEGFIVGYVGSQVAGRNLDVTIDAVGELEAEGVSLVMGGFGPLLEEMADRARGYNNIDFRSWVPADALYPLERTFDLFVYVVDQECAACRWISPNKLFTSMAFGCPIIVGEGTLAAERVAAIGNGIVVPYGDKKVLQEAILRIKNNPNLAREMGEKGRREFEHNWRPEVMATRLLEGYAFLGAVAIVMQSN